MPKSAKKPLNSARKSFLAGWLRGSKSAPSIMLHPQLDKSDEGVVPGDIKIQPTKPMQATMSQWGLSAPEFASMSEDKCFEAKSVSPPGIGRPRFQATSNPVRQHLISIARDLEVWQSRANFAFSSEKTITVSEVMADPEFQNRCSVQGSPGTIADKLSNEESPTLPRMLRPIGCKVFLHDDVCMVIGISSKSSRPSKLYFEAETAKCYERSEKYTEFYMHRCHEDFGCDSCCNPRQECIIIIGSSNTGFEKSMSNGISELRTLLKQAKYGQKVVLTCSQADGICTNMIGFAGFLKSFLDTGIKIELMVWWSNSKFCIFDLHSLVSQFHEKAAGGIIEPYYEDLLNSLARIAGNKEDMTKASRVNKQEGLGLRNALPIGTEDYSLAPETVKVSMNVVAKQERFQESLQSSSRSVQEISLSKNDEGRFICPTDGKTFQSIRAVIDHLVDAVMQGSEHNRACMFCGSGFDAPKQASRARKHLKRHIFEKLECLESAETSCAYFAKTEDDLDSHISHFHREDEVVDKSRPFQCGECGDTFTMQYHLDRHLRNSHNNTEVTCDKCDSTLRNETNLRDHQNRNCSGAPRLVTECEICHKTILVKRLSFHTLTAHTRSEQVTAFGTIMGIDA